MEGESHAPFRIAALLGGFLMSACVQHNTSVVFPEASISGARFVAVGEETTSWRVGDYVGYRLGCSRDAALDLAEAMTVSKDRVTKVYDHYNKSYRLDTPEKRECFIFPRPVPAKLVEWVAGPFIIPGQVSRSVWQVKDVFGDTEYIILPDRGGKHPYVQNQGA